MTNREWLNSLSDEELAIFVTDIGNLENIEDCEICPVFRFCFDYSQDKKVTCCDEVVKEWLKAVREEIEL